MLACHASGHGFEPRTSRHTSGLRQAAKAPVFQTGEHGFESRRPDQLSAAEQVVVPPSPKRMAAGSTPACGAMVFVVSADSTPGCGPGRLGSNPNDHPKSRSGVSGVRIGLKTRRCWLDSSGRDHGPLVQRQDACFVLRRPGFDSPGDLQSHMALWWNGRHARLKNECPTAYRFESCQGYHMAGGPRWVAEAHILLLSSSTLDSAPTLTLRPAVRASVSHAEGPRFESERVNHRGLVHRLERLSDKEKVLSSILRFPTSALLDQRLDRHVDIVEVRGSIPRRRTNHSRKVHPMAGDGTSLEKRRA